MGYASDFPEEETPRPPEADRRTGARYVTVMKVGRAIIGERDQLCLIRNFSTGGLKIDVPRELETNTPITIELRSDRVMHGTVRWAREHDAGIQIEGEVPAEHLLDNKPPSALLRIRPRAPRFQRWAPVQIMYEGEEVYGTLVDISLQGACIETHPVGRKDDRVVLTIAGLPPRSAFIRWADHGRMGFHFERPWPFIDLANWLEDHATGPDQAADDS